MVTLLIITILTALAAKGWQYATYTGATYDTQTNKIIRFNLPNKNDTPEILWWVRFYAGNFIIKVFKSKAEFILKPLFLCSVCACGFTSFVFAVGANMYFDTQIDFIQWAVIALSAGGLATLIND